MDQNKKTRYPARLKYLLTTVAALGLFSISSHVFAQGGPPPPPPNPLNIFKKHKKDTASKKADTAKSKTNSSASVAPGRPPGGPPPPPNPLDLFKKKKKDTTKKEN